MCNHYRDDDEIGAQADFLRLAVPGLYIPAALPRLPARKYRKSPARVVVQTAGARTVAVKSWGIRIAIKGATKRLIKPGNNARSDKLTSFTWKDSARHRRCLIPATGFFEWNGPDGAKNEILFTVKGNPRFFFAGMWDGEGFTMLMTEPNEFMRQFHDRMPVMLGDADALAWLGDEPLADSDLAHLCRGLPAEAILHEALPPKLKISRPGKELKTPDHDEGPLLL